MLAMTPPPLFIMNSSEPFIRSSALTFWSNIWFSSFTEIESATPIIQLPKSARDIHCPPIHKPRWPSGPLTSTCWSIQLLSEDQVHAWHLPHQKSALGLKR